jgi:hypothetical protein
MSAPSRFAALFLVLALASAAAFGQARSDAAREKRWADQILPSLVVGDAVQLQTAEGRFLALYTKAEPARGAVILAHGPGLHPDHGITGELRVHLADRGFTTLSLQMPVLPAEVDDGAAYRALYPEAARRIAAGTQYLQERGAKRIYLVSHAMGAGMAHEYLRANRAAPVSGWVALSFYGVFDGIAGAAFPVLDLYGAKDYRGIRGPASDRARLLRALPGSKQLAIADGGYFLAGGEKAVLQEVAAFLEALSAR